MVTREDEHQRDGMKTEDRRPKTATSCGTIHIESMPAAAASCALPSASESSINFLRLLQIADSTLPVGGAAQSFGIETLVTEGMLGLDSLEAFLQSYVTETAKLEAWFCGAGHRLGIAATHGEETVGEWSHKWSRLNTQLSALKVARESRNASLSMGRRLLTLMIELLSTEDTAMLSPAASPYHLISLANACHYAPTFGFCAGWMGIAARESILAFLQQNVAGLISVCQRLLPLGQTEAMRLSWQLKKALVQAVEGGMVNEAPYCCVPLLEIGAMRHATMNARMFIS